MSEIQVDNQGEICWVTLNRPESKNAFTSEMITTLCEELKKADANPQIKIIVLTGSGNCFCAGGDLKAMDEKTGMFAGDSFHLKQNYEHGIQQIPKTMESINKLTIAMVNGPAIGAGCDLTAMCDFRIVSETAKFGVTFGSLGIISGDGGPYFMNRIVGYPKALEMYLSSKIYSAIEAKEMGLATKVVSADKLKEETKNYCEQFLKISVEALTMAKAGIKHCHQHDLSSSLLLLASYQGIAQRTDFHESQVRKFLKKN